LAAADIATAAARQVLTEDLTPEADAKLIDQAITQLPSALAARHAA
jgi:F-type H+-transporting ATPase subunit b